MINKHLKYSFSVSLLVFLFPFNAWSCDWDLSPSFCTYNADVPTALISITCLDETDTFSVEGQYRLALVNEVFHGELDIRDTILVKSEGSSCDVNLYLGSQFLIKSSSLQFDTLYQRNFYLAVLYTPDYLHIEGDSVRGNIRNVNSNSIYDILFQKVQFDEFIGTFPDLCSPLSNSTNQHPEKQISIYPNPTTSKIYIEGNSERKTKYKIYSTNGILIKEGNFNLPEIDVSSLQQGIYCITIDDATTQYSNTFVKY